MAVRQRCDGGVAYERLLVIARLNEILHLHILSKVGALDERYIGVGFEDLVTDLSQILKQDADLFSQISYAIA